MHIKPRRKGYFLRLIPVLTLLMTLSCSFPSLKRATPTPPSAGLLPSPTPLSGTSGEAQDQPAAPTPTAEPLPPALLESYPLPGSIVAMDAPITLVFNQPMQRASVEAALSGAPMLAGRFDWRDDRTLTFVPDAPFLPNTSLELELATSALAQNGLALQAPVRLAYQTAGYLQTSQKLPEPGAGEVNPQSAVAVTFNQPVVPLGADPASLSPAFTLEPAASGRAEWLNTSTYIFYPEPPLTGGVQYTARLAPDLKSSDGGPLQSPEEWSFTVALPRLDRIEPANGQNGARLDTPIRLTFNQRMDPQSLEASFSLLDASAQPVPGTTAWNEAQTEFTFTPDGLLRRGSRYTVQLSEPILNAGGIPLAAPAQTSWTTEPALSISALKPLSRGSVSIYEGIQLRLSASLPDDDLTTYFSFIPAVPNMSTFFDPEQKTLSLFGDFTADTEYVLIASASLPDEWGGTLGQTFILPFRTDPLNPSLFFTSYNSIQFLTPEDTSISAQAANIPGLYLFRGRVTLSEFIQLSGAEGYSFQQTYRPKSEESWFTTLYASAQRVQTIEIPVSPDDTPLSPGLYFLRFDQSAAGYATPLTLVVSRVHLTLKLSPTDAFIWAVDLQNNTPVGGLSVSVFDNTGTPLATGLTGADGVFKSAIPALSDPFRTYYAIAEQPGDEMFGLTLLNWSEGVTPDAFGFPVSYQGPGLKTYVYTDRPIYRPGQTVYYRAAARQARNDLYSLPSQATLPVSLYDAFGARLFTQELPLSAYGTAHGEYTLIPDAAPGYYRLECGETSIYIQVAAYRKPEIDLEVSFSRPAIQLGEDLSARIQASYFFGAPAGDVKLSWTLYQTPAYFSLPDYQVGPERYGWLDIFPFFGMPTGWLGEPIAQGTGKTALDGTFSVEFPARAEGDLADNLPGTRDYTLEVTVEDESGQPVSKRAVLPVHPARFYIGLRPDAWVSQAGSEIGFDVQTVDWEQAPAGSQTLRGEFRKVTWARQEAKEWNGQPTFTPQYTAVSSVDFVTGPDGRARLSFIAPEPGSYQLEVSGGGAVTQVTLWVGGAGQAIWPNVPNQRLRLTADRDTYQPGEQAQVFIPNPFGRELDALVTVERSTVMSYQVIRLAASGSTITLPISNQEAPNVFLSALLVGGDLVGGPDFRLGMVELQVTPLEQTLAVTLTSQPERSGPGGQVTFEVRVTDAAGNPVQGEFSLALVDKAVLALADPNAPSILEAFYGRMPVRVRTGLALAGYARRNMFMLGGIGGGGGGEVIAPTVREKFPDTAYWNAEIVTDANGEAQVQLTLPDSLTTWQVDLRGLTVDTRVGQAQSQVVTSKDLLIRPVTPRFLVAGDHVLLAAVVQNNTPSELSVEVILQSNGFMLDESQAFNSIPQQVMVPAGGRSRVEWWGTAQDVPSVDLVFSAQAGELQDATRPASGALPVLRYTAPQAFTTSGLLENASQQLELVSLPQSFTLSSAGELRLELAPSLVAAMQTALDVLENFPYACTEQTLSRFLPNLEVYQAMQTLGITSPELQRRLERTLGEGLSTLQARQNADGGWSWWPGEASDPYITAYILFGLARARTAGVSVNPEIIQRAADYLIASLPTPEMTPESWQLDRLAFEQFALSQAGLGDLAGSASLAAARDRLSPWAGALLALTLEALSPGDPQVKALLSDLQATAVRTGTGAFWEDRSGGWSNMSSTLSTSAMVLYALSQLEPASPLLPEAARYLMANRQASGAWNSTYETAWVLMSLNEYVKGTGELSGNFTFQAVVNGVPFASGGAGGDTQLNTVQATLPASQLNLDRPNALVIQREAGPGRLYYTVMLDVALPAEDAAPLNRGLSISRVYTPRTPACQLADCQPVGGMSQGQQVVASLTLVLPQDAYHLLVEDYIPAGAEILDTSLKTSPLGTPADLDAMLGEPVAEEGPLYDPDHPFSDGWGWWLFNAPQVYDDHIAWSADFLPAGTYTLNYVLTGLQQGEFRVLPARARQFYFPEVQGSSAGTLFTISP